MLPRSDQEKMQIQFYKPRNEILKKYIEGYYFISSSNTSKTLHYLTFPNNFFIISAMSNADLCLSDQKIIVKESPKENFVANYVSRYTSPIEVQCQGRFNEVTIYFKPLGINQFIADVEPLFIHKSDTDFNPFPDFSAKMLDILKLEDSAHQQNELEKYWLSKFYRVDLSLLEKVIADVETDLKIDDIAQKYQYSRQYLNKLFKRSVGKTPIEFRKVHRFRNVIAKRKDVRNLTTLSYENLFYDQSHLIKDFKRLTKTSPNLFFKKVEVDKEYVWLFV